jgi:2-keto-4-pentenoate hydratase/2-oxohepta-3-ene-1,7-dioic acid hydratase in catechol pathway
VSGRESKGPIRIARYLGQDGEILEGVVLGEEADFTKLSNFGNLQIQEVSGLDAMLGGGRRLGAPRPIKEVKLLPWGQGRKTVCVGRNYGAHAKELGNEVPKEPLIFIKPATSLIGFGDAIEVPSMSGNVQFEAELAVVVGKRLRDASEAECEGAVAGFTCLNDVTARDIQKAETQFTRAKGFDTFCPVGPWVRAGAGWQDARIQTRLNGETKQDGRTSDQVFPVPRLLSFISHCMTLEAGDLVSTGTPAGVGAMQPGDVVEIEVEGVGILQNPIARRGK